MRTNPLTAQPLDTMLPKTSLLVTLSVYVAYIKRQLGVTTQVSVTKVKVTVTKIKMEFLLNNLSLLWPIDTKLGICGRVVKVIDFKPLGLCGFQSRQGHWILSCEEAIQLAYGMLVVLLPIRT
jgi:hypothetical protein